MSEPVDMNWLQALKPGDAVLSGSVFGHKDHDPGDVAGKVTRVTPARIYVDLHGFGKEEEYDRKTGDLRGGRFQRLWPATPTALKRIKDTEDKQRLYYKFSAVDWKKLPVEALRTIDGIVETHLPPKKATT